MLSRESIYYLCTRASQKFSQYIFAPKAAHNNCRFLRLFVNDSSFFFFLINRNLTFVPFFASKFNRICLRIIFIRDYIFPIVSMRFVRGRGRRGRSHPGLPFHRSRPKIYFRPRRTFATNLNKTIMKAEFDRRELNGNS